MFILLEGGMTKRFAITGVAGYIAPRHLKAIKDTGNQLIAAMDPHDSVGILDQFFPQTKFFREFERFDRYLEKLRRLESEHQIDFISICSPNYLHDAHIRLALRNGANVICEKPLVLNPWNIDALKSLEEETGRRVFSVLQLRLHPTIIKLKEMQTQSPIRKKSQIRLTYITSRGPWYLHSWKGNHEQSGGLATNIGIHFFDMLTWIYGDIEHCELHVENRETIAGFLELERASVQWFLSISESSLPQTLAEKGQRTYRSIEIDEQNLEFSGGFTDLHTEIYRSAIDGNGFGIEENRSAIEIVSSLRNMSPIGIQKNSHPMVRE